MTRSPNHVSHGICKKMAPAFVSLILSLVLLSCSKSDVKLRYGEGIIGKVHRFQAGGTVFLYGISETQELEKVVSVVTNLGFASCSIDSNAPPVTGAAFRYYGQHGLDVYLSYKFCPITYRKGLEIRWVAQTEPRLVTNDDWANWNNLMQNIRHALKEAGKGIGDNEKAEGVTSPAKQ